MPQLEFRFPNLNEWEVLYDEYITMPEEKECRVIRMSEEELNSFWVTVSNSINTFDITITSSGM